MLVARSIAEMRTSVRGLRSSRPPDATLGFVPTMGAIHRGHLSLVGAARHRCDLVAASIFVNPLQFAAGEDFDRYPRLFEGDSKLLAEAGVDILFAPDVEEMYPPSHASTFVEVPVIGDRLDGVTRPGHFRGVATVVTKLFNIVAPDLAFFGQKDAAQVAVLRAMVRDLNLPVQLVACPTVREPDGLALSSRNRYLTPAERPAARTLHRALRAAEALFEQGQASPKTLRAAMLKTLQSEPAIRVDYAEVVNPDTLQSVAEITGPVLLAVAAWVGSTRLIDNSILNVVQDD